jgi:hypothetical protein
MSLIHPGFKWGRYMEVPQSSISIPNLSKCARVAMSLWASQLREAGKVSQGCDQDAKSAAEIYGMLHPRSSKTIHGYSWIGMDKLRSSEIFWCPGCFHNLLRVCGLDPRRCLR